MHSMFEKIIKFDDKFKSFMVKNLAIWMQTCVYQFMNSMFFLFFYNSLVNGFGSSYNLKSILFDTNKHCVWLLNRKFSK